MNDTLPTIDHHFAVGSHNGTITITNAATGQHRTFRIKTQKADAKFAPGERIVSLLTGPDNEQSFTQFGFVKSNGYIALWNKYRTATFRTYCRMLRYPGEYADRCEYLYEGRCRRCDRKLTVPESIKSGIGPVCATK
jgi:hypothetical protein